MSLGLDTSVVLRLLIGEPEHQARSALRHLEDARRAHKQIFVSDLVVSECYFALQHHYGVPKQKALRTLSELLDSPGIIAQGCAREVLQTPRLATAKPGLVDRLIHLAYLREGITLVSFETAAAKLDRAIVLKARADQ